MGILLSWQLEVASILFLASFASSEFELPDLPTDSALYYKTLEDKKPTKLLSSVLYKSNCVNIYDSESTSNNKKIYFYSPITLLNHLNVASINNQTVTPKGILSVSYSVGNQEIRTKVVEHLNQLLSQQIEPSHVKVHPFDSVRLTSKVQSPDFLLTNEWIPYKPSLRFTLICPTREDCDRVKTQMRIDPKQFEHLRLEFNPQFINDDTCFNDGVGISQEDLSTQTYRISQEDLSIQVKELKKDLEESKLNFAKELSDVAGKLDHIFQETKQELLANMETKLAKDVNDIREASQVTMDNLKKELQENEKYFAATSQMFADKIKVAEENLAVALKSLEITRNELTQSKGVIEKLSAELNASLSHMETTTNNLKSITTEWSSTNAVVADMTTQLNDLQKRIGYADIKLAPVNFYVQRNSSFDKTKTPIPFELARVNEGNVMDLPSGIFTAPRKGTYFFSFTGVAEFTASASTVHLGTRLYLNGGKIGMGWVDEVNPVSRQLSSFTFQSTLNLILGDQVWVQIDDLSSGVKLFDNVNHNTHFSGFVLKEDIDVA